MSKISPLQNPATEQDRIDEQARAWVIRLDGESMAAEDYQQFRAWLAEGDQQRQAFKRIAELWDVLDTVMPELADSDIAAEAIETETVRGSQPWYYGLAACLLLGVMVLLSFQYSNSLETYQSNYATQIGELETVSLPDGSGISLNTKTSTNVNFDHKSRVVHLLEGEAHFDVAPDPDKPFVVYVADVAVRAVGTAFTVQLKADNSVEVTVTEGKVAMTSFEQPIAEAPDSRPPPEQGKNLGSLIEGQHMVVNQSDVSLENLPAPRIEKKLSWRQGMLSFEEDRLEDVINEVGRYTSVEIEILDPQMKDLRIDGYFPSGRLDMLLATLEGSFDIKVERLDEQSIQLSRK
ncbi:FecR family protein [Pseudoteredinibacter isoporae]|uniref:Transmembrane sensor n=1 Tax=Pseudoteredinibacter isoporae TaxID=570281 RepID=A0A7X0JUK1_9GAMM|nr:FecR domain-containing protein [Pseudoteredinibacter isoporae]MBB6522534.1 transmembrane sensor [Pseudoteredinibacter isoporae]NHO88064.1 DUF4880 domain-containing protein [Pseudoteredinibacter isoporae]NIB23605.1 DUF4880 domain-containing protein [Pseudoteredinibacter isoporae]